MRAVIWKGRRRSSLAEGREGCHSRARSRLRRSALISAGCRTIARPDCSRMILRYRPTHMSQIHKNVRGRRICEKWDRRREWKGTARDIWTYVTAQLQGPTDLPANDAHPANPIPGPPFARFAAFAGPSPGIRQPITPIPRIQPVDSPSLDSCHSLAQAPELASQLRSFRESNPWAPLRSIRAIRWRKPLNSPANHAHSANPTPGPPFAGFAACAGPL
jgi:hypothetical protein